MCFYGYQIYLTCSHRLIKLAALCKPILFDAASSLSKKVTPCPELIYSLYLQGQVTDQSYWQCFEDSCPSCTRAKAAAPDRDVALDRFIPMADYHPVLLRPENLRSHPWSNATSDTISQRIHQCKADNIVQSDAHDNTHPYYRIIQHRISWLEMIGLEDQIGKGGPKILFAGRIGLYMPPTNKTLEVEYKEELKNGESRIRGEYLFHNGGLTKWDREFIRAAAEERQGDLHGIYWARFPTRGMSFLHFSQYATELPEIIPGPNTPIAQIKDAYIQLCELRDILKMGPPTIVCDSRHWFMYPMYTPGAPPINIDTFFLAQEVPRSASVPIPNEPVTFKRKAVEDVSMSASVRAAVAQTQTNVYVSPYSKKPPAIAQQQPRTHISSSPSDPSEPLWPSGSSAVAQRQPQTPTPAAPFAASEQSTRQHVCNRPPPKLGNYSSEDMAKARQQVLQVLGSPMFKSAAEETVAANETSGSYWSRNNGINQPSADSYMLPPAKRMKLPPPDPQAMQPPMGEMTATDMEEAVAQARQKVVQLVNSAMTMSSRSEPTSMNNQLNTAPEPLSSPPWSQNEKARHANKTVPNKVTLKVVQQFKGIMEKKPHYSLKFANIIDSAANLVLGYTQHSVYSGEDAKYEERMKKALVKALRMVPGTNIAELLGEVPAGGDKAEETLLKGSVLGPASQSMTAVDTGTKAKQEQRQLPGPSITQSSTGASTAARYLDPNSDPWGSAGFDPHNLKPSTRTQQPKHHPPPPPSTPPPSSTPVPNLEDDDDDDWDHRGFRPSPRDQPQQPQPAQHQQYPPGPPLTNPATGERIAAQGFNHFQKLCNQGWVIDS